MRWFGLLTLTGVLLALCGCSRQENKVASAKCEPYDFRPVLIARCYQTLMEKPDASRVLLLGEPAVKCREIFEKAGVKTYLSPGGGMRFDIVVFGCNEISAESLHKVMEKIPENGIVAWFMDTRGISSETLYGRFLAFDCPVAHLWMAGEDQWLLVGRKARCQLKLESMLEIFARERAFDQLCEMGSGTLPGLFAGYVGTLEEILPAFVTRQRTDLVCPQNYIPKDIPIIDWVSSAGVDEDITRTISAEIRSMQVVRRLVVEGNVLAAAAKDKKDEERATETWGRAFLRNPGELFLLERINRLEHNAKGFLSVGKVLQAMKCYETIVLINPKDAAAVHNFGQCLKKIGKLDLAEKVLNRSKELQKHANTATEMDSPLRTTSQK